MSIVRSDGKVDSKSRTSAMSVSRLTLMDREQRLVNNAVSVSARTCTRSTFML